MPFHICDISKVNASRHAYCNLYIQRGQYHPAGLYELAENSWNTMLHTGNDLDSTANKVCVRFKMFLALVQLNMLRSGHWTLGFVRIYELAALTDSTVWHKVWIYNRQL